MFKNFFKIAFRNVVRHKSFSFLNITGLTIGLTACILISLFVWDEKQFDKHIPKGEQVYRVYYKVEGSEGSYNNASSSPMIATALQQNFPEVEKSTRILNIQNKAFFEVGDKRMYEKEGILADQTFFDVFLLAFKYGSSANTLTDPTSIILSEEMAEKYFGRENPVGRELIRNKKPYQIKGVYKSTSKFHLAFNYILPMAVAQIPEEQMQNWGWYQFHNYVKLKDGVNASALETKFQKYAHPFLNDGKGSSVFTPHFQALYDVHLHSADFKFDIAKRGNITYVRAFTIIAVFILLIACFNFVNLATAKSLQRAKEVGVRKTIGANRPQLVLQFIAESMLLVFISITIAAALSFLLLPLLNQFTEKQIVFPLFSDPLILLIFFTLAIMVGVLAGFYPALILSHFQPVKVLKGNFTGDGLPGRVPWLRHGLVVIQFSLSVLLLISAIVVIKQTNYLHNKDLGFNKEQIIFFPLKGDTLRNNYESFKAELLQSPLVSAVSVGYGFPGDQFGDGMMTVAGSGVQTKATQMMVDHDYVKTLGVKLLAGRDFSKQMETDKDQAYIINETAVRDLGLGTPEKAIGKTLLWPTWQNPDSMKRGQVIGVVKDFHYKSLYDKVEPAVLQIYPNAYSKVAVKVKTAGIDNSLAHVKNVWNKFSPDYPLDYRFLDENFEKMK
jgi:putative ABC transport system permease protein